MRFLWTVPTLARANYSEACKYQVAGDLPSLPDVQRKRTLLCGIGEKQLLFNGHVRTTFCSTPGLECMPETGDSAKCGIDPTRAREQLAILGVRHGHHEGLPA